LEWIESKGTGIVHSFTVIHRPPTAVYTSLTPYVVALIDLSEGPRMMANVIGKDALAVRIGDPVAVTFEARGEFAKVPQFVRAVS
jgi:uncharacterized OB-fold protein